MFEKLLIYLKTPLYKNSMFITLSRFLNVGTGFIFWMMAARLYPIEAVGIATALVSSLNIIITFSRFGFDLSLIRFIQTNDKKKVINTALAITTLAAFVIAIIYMIGIKIFSSSLIFIQQKEYAILFLVFVTTNSIVSITGVTFTAIRTSEHYFYQNILLASRVPLLIPMIFLGGFGIFGSMGLAYILAAVFAFLHLNKIIEFDFKIDNQFLKDAFFFSSGNYLSNVFLTIPSMILPIMILGLVGEANAAKYYIAYAVGNLVLIIPESLSTSLFIEGSHGENLKKNTIRVVFTVYVFLIPAIIVIYLFGGYLLNLIGKDYSGALDLLRIIVLSSIFIPISSLFVSIQNVRMRVKNIVKLNFLMFVLLPILSYVLILRFGIIGVGYAWMLSNGILSITVLIMIKKMGWTVWPGIN